VKNLRFNYLQKIISRSFYVKEKHIFIYTEDKKSDEFFYHILFKRLENDKTKIIKIEPLGSKSMVMLRSMQDLHPPRPTLYIVDGDIELINQPPIETNNLIGLDRYCIENFLCCENAILSLLETNLGNSTNYFKSKLRFNETLNVFGKQLFQIAIRYSIAHNLSCSTGFKKSSDFLNIRGSVIKPDKSLIRSEINRVEKLIKEKLKESGVRSYKKELNNRVKQIEEKIPLSTNTYLKYLSGKDMLLPIFILKLKKIDKSFTNWTIDQIKRHLAERIDVNNLNRIRQKIQQIS
jgi:hypothetical protein